MERKTSAAQARAKEKYDKANTKGVYIKLNKKTDADILRHLGACENVQGYLKQLIREDMARRDKIIPNAKMEY